MANVTGAVRAWAVVAILLASPNFPSVVAQVYQPQVLDFNFPGEGVVEVTADVIVGTLKIKASVGTQQLQSFESYIAGTLAAVCPTLTRVIVKAFQVIESYRNVDIDLHTEYFLQPSNRDSAQCKKGLVDSAAFRQLLAWRITSDGTAGPGWDAMTWTVAFTDPVVRRITIRYPERLPRPALSTTPPGPLDPYAGRGFSFGGGGRPNPNGTGVHDPKCNYAMSACVCATTTSCGWLPWEGTFRCIGLGGPLTSISCADCALQNRCSRNQVQTCDLNREPCTCATSTNDCRWDLSTMSCVPKNGVSTPCTACSRQDHCDSPQVRTVDPGQNSKFGVSSRRQLTITFDRFVTLQSVMEGVTFRCTGDSRPTVVSPSLLTIASQVLTIQVASFPRATEAACHLALGEGVVRDNSGLNFRGTEANWYAFRLQDTMPPTLDDFSPPNGAEGIVPGISTTLVFSEPIVLDTSCEVSLMSRGVDVASFSLASTSVTLDRERKRLTIALGTKVENSRAYSLRLPSGCAADDTGNAHLGLSEGVYIFHTQIDTFNAPTSEDQWKIILGAALGGVAGLVILVSCTILWCRIRSARQDFATRLAESATKARRWSTSSMDGIWTEFSNYRPRRFSFDSFAMSGWSGKGKPAAEGGETRQPPRPPGSKSSNADRKVHPDPTFVAAKPMKDEARPDSQSTRPGTSLSGVSRGNLSSISGMTGSRVGTPQPNTLRVHALHGSRAAAEIDNVPNPPAAQPPMMR